MKMKMRAAIRNIERQYAPNDRQKELLKAAWRLKRINRNGGHNEKDYKEA